MVKKYILNFTPNISIIMAEYSLLLTGIWNGEDLKVIAFLHFRSGSFRLLPGKRKVQYFEPFGCQEMWNMLSRKIV